MDNKLAAFYAKIKKLVTDYMAYCDMAIKKAESVPKTLVVTVDEETGEASHNSKQIYNHIQNGGNVVLSYLNEMWALTNALEDCAKFATICGDEHYIYSVYVYDDGSIETFDCDFIGIDSVPSQLVVTVDSNNKASHSAEEIYQHIQNGGTALLRVDNEDVWYYVGLSRLYANAAIFLTIDEDLYFKRWEIVNSKDVYYTRFYLVAE